ncbi:MAG: Na+:solute symporter [Bryobacterales bacterium]|nr:Na+:solute symporter [Bryobacterales bacterium]
MQLSSLDWAVLIAYLGFTLGVAFVLRKRASSGIEEFFVSGRNTHWWLAGVSMVATTFAADTPLAVTGMTASGGVAGNWLWWNFALSGLLTTFFFARLWRRCGVLTDVELAELRYSGRPAAFLRGFRAAYLAFVVNVIVLGWVNLAMVKILMLTLGIDKPEAVAATLCVTALTCIAAAMGGLRGVLITDMIQFFIMLGMAVLLAVYAVDGVGGLGALQERLLEMDPSGGLTAFWPRADSPLLPLATLATYLAVVWWGTWYPGSEPGGGGFIAQRMFSTRDEREAQLATLSFNVLNFSVRPWPWILVALVALVAYPDLQDKEAGYMQVMFDYLPASLRGLMLAGFLAAFMSTVSTNLNWGAGYVVSDLYRRFLRPEASEKQLISASRWATALLAVLASIATFYMDSIAGAWKWLLAAGAGTGGVLILRWFWWRVNAWSEITAMTAAAVISAALQFGWGYDTDKPLEFAHVMLITVSLTTLIWVAVTLLSRPEPAAKLEAFYRVARPYRAGWAPVAAAAPDVRPQTGASRDFQGWIASCALVYCSLFGVGKLLLADASAAAPWLIATVVAAIWVARCLRED